MSHSPSADEGARRLPTPVRITEQVWPEGTAPVVTIRCTTYQHVNFIRDAIEGFLLQETTFPVEILIHDDASNDGTADIVRQYQTKYPRLIRTALQTENQYSKGAEARAKLYQRIASMARGEFVSFCEGDDYWHDPLKLNKQVALMRADSTISLATSDVDILHQKTRRVVKSVFRRTGNMPHAHEDFSFGLLTRKYIFITCTFMVRRQDYLTLIESNPDEFSGKWPFWDMQLMLECSHFGRIHFIPESLATYRKLEESASSSQNPEHHARNIVALIECTEHYARKFGYGDDVTRRSRASLIGSLAGFALRFSSETLRKQVLELMERYLFPISDPTTRMVFWVVQSEQRLSKYGRLLSLYLECLRLYRRATNRAVALLR